VCHGIWFGDMIDIYEIMQDTQDQLDKLLSSTEANIVKSLERLEKKLVSAYHAGVPSGTDKFTIVQQQKLQRELLKIMENDYGILVNSVTKDYSNIQDIIEYQFSGLEITFDVPLSDRKLIGALKQTSITQFKQFQPYTENLLSQSLLDGVGGGLSFAELVEDMRNILTGVIGKGGIPMATRAKVFAHDALSAYFQTISNKGAAAAGIKKFVWYGSVKGSSRAKCIASAGHVFTEKQINSMDGDKWRGKAPRPTMIARGGYHCRHSLVPIKEEWIEGGMIKQQSYFDENPGAYTEKLQKEVAFELNRL